METLAITGITIAGHTLFGRVIYDTYDLVRDTTTHPVINSVLSDLDLQSDLNVIEALIRQVDKQIENLSEDDALAISLHQVDNLVHRIKDELAEIKTELKLHEEKWFSSWRSANYQKPLNRLTRHKKLLDKRVNMLIELIKLHK